MISQPTTTLINRTSTPAAVPPRIRSFGHGLTRLERLVKRGLDITVAVGLLLLVLPVLLLLAVTVILESPGPVLYRQKYVGEGGRLFDMFRFRISHGDTEVDAVRQIRWHHDQVRLTSVGAFMRDMHLEDLPLLVNVLRGDISLVGPRPELPRDVEKYEEWQRVRLSVPQGLTGWWQVTGHLDAGTRSSTQGDLYYVTHHSVWLDIKILLMTIPVLLEGKGEF